MVGHVRGSSVVKRMTDKAKRALAADIGDDALDREPGGEREAFIEQKCAGDADLVNYVCKYLDDFQQFRISRFESTETLHTMATNIEPRSAEPITAASSGDVPGVIIDGRYALLKVVGSGGMGKVYLAQDYRTGDHVAIKLARDAEALGEQGRMRLVREARIACGLFHPNIFAVYDIGQVNGSLFIVMEYVRARPLTHWAARHADMPLQTKLSIMIQVADALAYADRRGVIHRDIKPANILVQPAGPTVKVVDFGVAEQSGFPNDLVQGGGTILYMSPEQLRRERIDARSDIWSAGITLYELITGALPFHSVREILTAPVPSLAPVVSFSDELNIILTKTLAKDRQLRYRTAEELSNDLKKIASMCPGGNSDILPPHRNPTEAHIQFDRLTRTPFEPIEIPPGLNFDLPTTGVVRAKEGCINRWRVLRKKLEFFFVEPNCVRVLALALFFSPVFLFRRLELFIGIPNSKPFDDMVVIALVLSWSIAGIGMGYFWCYVVVCLLQALGSIHCCENCRLSMRQTARFSVLCQTRIQVTVGYRDVYAALKYGLWLDAARLLQKYGFTTASARNRYMAPAQYNLRFFECGLCKAHAARLTVDDMMEDHWEEQPKYSEVFQCDQRERPTLKAHLWHACKTWIRMTTETFNRLGIRAAVSLVLLAIFSLISTVLGFVSIQYLYSR